MVFLKFVFILILSMQFLSCAKNLPSNLKQTETPEQVSNVDSLNGSFKLSNGNEIDLSSLNDQPTLLFFASETCQTCRQETEHLIARISASGLPTKIRLISILIGSRPDDIDFWQNSFSPNVQWLIGSDENLILYRQYFANLVTPSIMFFDPTSKQLKRWQIVLSIDELIKETGSWY